MNDDEKLRLTPKGFLAVELKAYGDIDEIWDKLTKFVEKRLEHEGVNGIPCIMMKDGGRCIAVSIVEEEA